MDLRLLTSPLPKPDVNLSVNSIQANAYVSNMPYVVKTGSGVLELKASDVVRGVLILADATTGSVVIPISSVLDTYFTDQGITISSTSTFIWTVISRNDTDVTFSSATQATLTFPRRQAAGRNITTQFIFAKVDGVWTCLNG